MTTSNTAAVLQNKTIKLSEVTMSYRLGMPAAEPAAVVVLLHGFPDSNLTFKAQEEELWKEGMATLTPVLPGYEVSSLSPGGRYSLDWVSSTLLEFIKSAISELKLQNKPLHLVGHDWGAMISYLLAARDEKRFSSLTALAIPPLKSLLFHIPMNPVQLRNSWYIAFFQLPLLSEEAVSRDGGALVKKLWADWSPGYEAAPGLLERVTRAFSDRRVLTAALDYYRNLVRFWNSEWHSAWHLIGKRLSISALVMYGERDGCLDAALMRDSLQNQDTLANLQVYASKTTGHFLHLENPGEINGIMLPFLRKNSGK